MITPLCCGHTVVPTVLSTGQLLPTILIFRNLKNVPKCKFPSDLVVAASKTGVMTSDFLTNVYLPKVSKIIDMQANSLK